jgi:hypothetical protein
VVRSKYIKKFEKFILNSLPYSRLAFVDVFERFSFSLGMYLPNYQKVVDADESAFFGQSENGNAKLKYAFCRVVFRGPVTNLMSDINGLDIYTNSVLGVDRYRVAEKLFAALKEALSL